MLTTKSLRWLALLSLLLPAVSFSQVNWDPTVGVPKGFDWIRMYNGEWLKGELISMYDGTAEFDSDEFGVHNIDFGDIHEIHTDGPMSIHLESGADVIGVLTLRDGMVSLDDGTTFPVSDIVSLTTASKTEWDNWSGKLSLGGNLRTGNTEQTDLNARFTIKRLEAGNRLILDYIGNYSEAFGATTENNNRLTGTYDWLIVKRLYWRIVGAEWFRDPFQNIDSRTTLSTALGYQIIDTAKFDWEITGGPGYQWIGYTEQPDDRDKNEETSVALIDTRIDWDITPTIEFFTRYQYQKVSEDAGDQVHHAEVGFDMDLVFNLDFIITYYHDYIANPAPDSDGDTPENTDKSLVFSLGWDF